MLARCSNCELSFERQPGFYLGSIYVNYGVTALLVLVTYLVLLTATEASDAVRLTICSAIVIGFPLWFFRYARSFWLGFDYYFDPEATGK